MIATGESHSVRELVDVAFAHAGLDPGKYVKLDPKFLRPAEVDHLIGDAAKARSVLGWKPDVTFQAAGDDDGGRGRAAPVAVAVASLAAAVGVAAPTHLPARGIRAFSSRRRELQEARSSAETKKFS